MRLDFAAILCALTACFLVFGIAPVQAQATRTWVSGVGDDANPCTREAPCRTFAGAISKTPTGGVIDCIGPVSADKKITINCGTSETKELVVWVAALPKIKLVGAGLGYTVMVAGGEFGTVNVIYTKEGKSDEGHGLLGKKWDQRETINLRYLQTSEGFQPTLVKRFVEQKPPVGPWRVVVENTEVPPELLAAIPTMKN